MSYKIVEDVFLELEKLKMDKTIFITDKNVYKIYKDSLASYKDRIIIINPGEENKNIDTLQFIYESLIRLKADRNTIIVTFGGGVVGDIGGYASATFKRGTEYIQIPTTLLSQTDSSIGGKTAIDFNGYKNLIGAFHFPKVSLIDINILKTLDRRQLICGFGEVLKYGLIYEYEFFLYCIDNKGNILNGDLKKLKDIVKRSVEIKAKIVDEDKYDNGIRRNLNFGHTVGHGIESSYEYGRYNHGESVIIGIIIESFIGYKRGLIDEDYYREIYEFLIDLVDIDFEMDSDKIIGFIREDKKNIDGNINMVLPNGRGRVDVFNVLEDEIIFAIENFRSWLICLMKLKV